MITNEEVNIGMTSNSATHKDFTNKNLTIEANKDIIRGDSIKIQGFVDIKNGDTHIKGKNKFTQSILKHIINFLSNDHSGSTNTTNFGCYSYTIYIGADTITQTLYNTTTLTTPIGTAPGTPPNILSGGVTNPSPGVFKITITATWNPGTVSGTVGEMALYLSSHDTLEPFGWYSAAPQSSNRLASRLSVANGNFSAFGINIANPLVITWTIQLSF